MGVFTEPQAKCLTTSNQRIDAETETFVVANALDRMAGGPDDNSAQANHLVAQRSVRRLTPVECERLMSWPDGWTAIDGEDTPDGRRYAACGNGVVSNVSEWIGRRIMAVEREG
jgi:site-specific DNA-cytosine methylase